MMVEKAEKMGLAAEVEAANVDEQRCSTCATRWRLSVPIGVMVGEEMLGWSASEARGGCCK